MAPRAAPGHVRFMSDQATRSRASQRRACLLGAVGAACVVLVRIATLANAHWAAAEMTEKDTLEGEKVKIDFEEKTPFVVAEVTFGVQTSAAICFMWLLQYLAGLTNLGLESEKSPAISGLYDALKVYLIISSINFVGYACFATSCSELMFVHLPGAGGVPYLRMRNVLWLISTPLQWLCFSRACTTAGMRDVAVVMASTVVMQLTGIIMLSATTVYGWSLCFCLSMLAFLVMFEKVFRFPLVKEVAFIARPVLYSELALWTAYPLAFCARGFGFIGLWTEQVLIYTVLDVLTKTICLSAIAMAHFYIVLSRTSKAMARARSKTLGFNITMQDGCCVQLP